MRPMFTLGIVAAVILLVFCCVAVAKNETRDPHFDINRMADALRMVEHWDGQTRGSAGERGPWQFTLQVWQQHSSMPFEWAEGYRVVQREEQRRVALDHIRHLQTMISFSKLPVNAYTVALAWTAGVSATVHHEPHRPSKAKRDYARRAENLYHDLQRQQTKR
jgi:hypothetical protein